MFFKSLKPYGLVLASALALSACGDSDTTPSPSAKSEKPGISPNDLIRPGKKLTQADVEKIIKNYIISNPEVLMEAISNPKAQKAYEEKQRAQQKAKAQSAIKDNAKSLFHSSFSPVGGNKNGDVAIIEFFDYNCPYCRKSAKQLNTFLKTDDKVKVIYKEFPIFGGASLQAAKAALASKKQGKYKQFHESLLAGKKRLTPPAIFAKAKEVGLDIARLKKDMESEEIKKEIAEVARVASELGIQGTPAYLIGDNLIPGAPQNLVERMKTHTKNLRNKPCKYC